MSGKFTLQDWVPIDGSSQGMFKVVMPGNGQKTDAEKIFNDHKADHKILNAAIYLQEQEPDAKVTLVTKDINLRLKAKSLNVPAEDYETGKVQDVGNLYVGKSIYDDVPSELINKLFDDKGLHYQELLTTRPINNHYFILRNGTQSALAYFNPENELLERVDKRTCYGVSPKNAEQAFAMHAVLNPNVRLVSIQGVAGTGKTLLALASAIEKRSDYRMILIARPVVALGNKDLGFLPGDIESKLDPYMEPLWDNLKFIKNQFPQADKNHKRIDSMLETEKIQVIPLAYIRGRSLSRVIFIVDEAQNLTPHEIKTIITRAGEGAKLIFTGDINQIDTPYLDAQSNGFSYMIDKLKGQNLFAHVTLEKGERSELANLANELL